MSLFRPLCGLFFCVLLLVGCGGRRAGTGHGEAGDTLRFRHARLLTVVRYADHTHVEISDPWQPSRLLHSYDLPARPLRRLLVATAAHARLLHALGAGQQIAAVCDAEYMKIPSLRQRIARSEVADCGSAMRPDRERVAMTDVDAVVASPFQGMGGYGALALAGSALHAAAPVIEAADYMEPTALGRAEWMRLYGLLTGHQREADSLFRVVETRYRALRQKARDRQRQPQVITERKTGGVWYCPGGRSTQSALIADAGGRYIYAADTHSGSLALAPERVADQARAAGVWLLTSGGAPGTVTRQSLRREYAGYALLRAWREGRVYVCYSDCVPYFEETPFRPDLLLEEYLHIFHGQDGSQPAPLRYYHKIRE